LVHLLKQNFNFLGAIAMAFAGAVLLSLPGYSQISDESLNAPEKTREVVDRLNDAEWENVAQGLRSIRAVTRQGILFNAFEISPENFLFEISVQRAKTGDWVEDVGKREGALIVTNAGFFAEKTNGELYSVGFLQHNGEVRSKAWKRAGGFINFTKDGPLLSPSTAGVPDSSADMLQTKPMMIEPGGKWAMRSNLGEVKHRSIFCRLETGVIILATITRGGMSLFEAGWVMRSEVDGGYFGCDSAVALDGGRSTQMWFAEKPEISFPGLTPVHNFLLVKPKS